MQLYIVVDSANRWLYYGRGTLEQVTARAKNSTDYDPNNRLYIYAVSSETVIEPE